MNFTKIKWSAKDRKVSLSWVETKVTGDTIEHTLTSPDAPRPEFLKALTALQPFAAEICECEEWGKSFRPIGVTLTSGKDGEEGVVITCLRSVQVSPAPVVVNTPHLLSDAWPRGLVDALNLLETEAELYVHGNRAQTEMFDGKEEEGAVTIRAAGEEVTMSSEAFSRAARRITEEAPV